MKKYLIIVLILIFSLMPRFSFCKNIYFSMAPTISLENFDLVGTNETIEKEESWGLNLKFGYVLDEYISLEIDYDFIKGFEGILLYNNSYIATDMQIYTIMPMFKASIGSDKYKNYFSTGFGYMHMDWGEVKTDVCWKAGVGFDYFFTKSLSLGANINYVVGLGDVKFVEYYNGSLDLSFIF